MTNDPYGYALGTPMANATALPNGERQLPAEGNPPMTHWTH
ncbi:hypothetical protein [Scytonema sp. PRP1]|jgi:hypothetical protein